MSKVGLFQRQSHPYFWRLKDRVKIGDFTGDVMDVRLQVVHLRTIKNEEIVVPS